MPACSTNTANHEKKPKNFRKNFCWCFWRDFNTLTWQQESDLHHMCDNDSLGTADWRVLKCAVGNEWLCRKCSSFSSALQIPKQFSELRTLISSNSIWTVELAHLLHSHLQIPCHFFTSTIGGKPLWWSVVDIRLVEESYATQPYYKEEFDDDKPRINQLFKSLISTANIITKKYLFSRTLSLTLTLALTQTLALNPQLTHLHTHN